MTTTPPLLFHNCTGRIPFVLMATTAILLAALSAAGDAALYSSWWMIALWTALALSACVWIVQSKGLSLTVVLVHSSLLLILAGAAVTHFTSLHGTLHLRAGEPTEEFSDDDGTKRTLPFAVTLDKVGAVNYPGTSTPMDFTASVRSANGGAHDISLNRVASENGYRLVLTSYDDDFCGATFIVSRDNAGRTVSYAGYILFVIAAVVALVAPKGAFHNTLRRLRTSAVLLILICGTTLSAVADDDGERLPSLPESTSKALSRLPVFYNGRVAPFGTLETEFASTVASSTHWEGYYPAQIAEGFLFYFGSWKEAPLMEVKSPSLRKSIQLGDGERACYTQWFDAVTSGRIDTDSIAASTDKKAREDLARFESINALVSGAMLRFFPVKLADGTVKWYAPADNDIPMETDTGLWLFIRKSPGYLNECIVRRDFPEAEKVIGKIALYQKKNVGESAIPSDSLISAELFYNRVARPFIPAGIGLLVGIWLTVALLRRRRVCRSLTITVVGLLWLWVTLLMVLRGWITDHMPLANGFETMQFMGWSSLTFGLVMALRGSMPTPFAIMAGSLALLVSAIGSRAAMVTPLMPVLASSPLLSIHVMLVMAAYSLMAMMAIAGIIGLLTRDKAQSHHIALMERAMLYPAVFLIGAGIFAGAVWADMSWGRYWGWDPKEVWALVSMLVYSFAAHPKSLPSFNKPRTMHIFCIAAFATVLFTYLGVNLLLPGLHSYA